MSAQSASGVAAKSKWSIIHDEQSKRARIVAEDGGAVRSLKEKPVKGVKEAAVSELTPKTRFLTLANFLFIAFLLIQALPNVTATDPQASYALIVVTAVWAVGLLVCGLTKSSSMRDTTVDIVSVVIVVLGAWTLATCKFDVLPSKMFPAPGIVFAQMLADAPKIAEGIGSSLGIVVQGFVAGAVSAVVLGLVLGYHARSARSTEKVVSFLAAIPPIVYIPYGIALLPTFRSVSVLVIFLATFWPALTSTLSGVSNVDRKAIDSARVLNVSAPTMLFRIILPSALPHIFNGLNIGLTISFILLTSAEMIGGRTGMGYYVKYYSDFGDYTRILVGIIVIGVVITVITLLFTKLQKRLTRWK